MACWRLYSDDVRVASFEAENARVLSFTPERPELLPMQIREAGGAGFDAWLRERAVDLDSAQHRRLMQELVGSRDKLTLALRTHMFSVSDLYTCFEDGAFCPRESLCSPEAQNEVSRFILVSGDTSLRGLRVSTPNASTDGSFTKTWRYEEGGWWLYKLQSADATRAEVEISRVLRACGFDAAEYAYAGRYRTRVRSRNFLRPHEFFEPYASFRFAFRDAGDDEETIAGNLSSLGEEFARAWRRICLSDALFCNTDRHMRNFGVIRSAGSGEVLRLAPNFDNNQAYRANPGGRYSDAMLAMYMENAGAEDLADLRSLLAAMEKHPYLSDARSAAERYLRA